MLSTERYVAESGQKTRMGSRQLFGSFNTAQRIRNRSREFYIHCITPLAMSSDRLILCSPLTQVLPSAECDISSWIGSLTSAALGNQVRFRNLHSIIVSKRLLAALSGPSYLLLLAILLGVAPLFVASCLLHRACS